MKFDKYYEGRNIISEIIKNDLIGPVFDDEILCDELPQNYYITGILYPQNSSAESTSQTSTEDCGELDGEEEISLSNGKNPSSFGLSFSLNSDVSMFTIASEAAKYRVIERKEAQRKLNFKDSNYKKNATFWQRCSLDIKEQNIDVNELVVEKQLKLDLLQGEQIFIKVILHKVYSDGSKTISVSMINENISTGIIVSDGENTVFQPEIRISSKDNNAFSDVRRNVGLTTDPEIAELSMLYSRVKDYASGHGCSVDWEQDDDGEPILLKTVFLPEYELKQMMPSASFTDSVCSMLYISENNYVEVRRGLLNLTDSYRKWIDDKTAGIEDMDEKYRESAEANMRKCKETLDILEKSIEALKDEDVFRAFRLANKAMFNQRKQMLITTKKVLDTPDVDWYEKVKWYPFQLAFFLQEIYSIVNPDSPERKTVDLLWFPTGGGKTEAYLGIAAFTIFLRRIRLEDTGNGVTVIMRYTLRLLSFQQFERASKLICSCEEIRRSEKLKGGEIGIGLWVGGGLTPNKVKSAKDISDGKPDKFYPDSNPFQVKVCPWCGSEITKDEYDFDVEKKRMKIRCSDSKCAFSNGLPLHIIDDDIYAYRPTFLVATVDKFAQLALNSDTASLFGLSDFAENIPPELIIQDELHLIAGPMGTITGVYEAAIKRLCEYEGHYPKVVASTATIRNAPEQIKALYASDYTQFPPQGTDINDSYFAEISTRDSKPARNYLGCMAVGTSPTTMMIRVMASLLFASRFLHETKDSEGNLFDEGVIDSFWTETGYFNTLRELGGAIIRVIDDIQDRYGYLKESKFAEKYPTSSKVSRYDNYIELTSRVESKNIGDTINQISVPFKRDKSTSPFDFILSSNMISVGVDVGRLGSMVVIGQPKTTAEYIQATSRVGRETPGLVIATYNQSKSRDRSHYEQFRQYHESFYRYVEATSVTPFSDRARDRALHTLFVILCRYLIPGLRNDSDAKNFSPDMPGIEEIEDYITNYVGFVDPGEVVNVKTELNEIKKAWVLRKKRIDDFRYGNNANDLTSENTLFAPDFLEENRFRVMNTMRSVETTIKMVVLDRSFEKRR